MNWLGFLKKEFCRHRFAMEDLKLVNADSEGADRVHWPCDKCGKVFSAHCGLDISPSNGPTFRRNDEAPKEKGNG